MSEIDPNSMIPRTYLRPRHEAALRAAPRKDSDPASCPHPPSQRSARGTGADLGAIDVHFASFGVRKSAENGWKQRQNKVDIDRILDAPCAMSAPSAALRAAPSAVAAVSEDLRRGPQSIGR